jgi:hypothetical protein
MLDIHVVSPEEYDTTDPQERGFGAPRKTQISLALIGEEHRGFF